MGLRQPVGFIESKLGFEDFLPNNFDSRCQGFTSVIWTPGSQNENSRMNFVFLELLEVCGLPEDPLVMLSLILMIAGMPKMPLRTLMVKMAGESSYRTTLEVEVEAEAEVAVVGVVDALDLI
ncbi:hypothetical protein AAHA92_21482 [Salvia divinorum]|uniref:Uncharacterized protein n=1 Tax=Salvia divinorum TaxID=28513 RepID=A0ABD1GKK8_SALDI